MNHHKLLNISNVQVNSLISHISFQKKRFFAALVTLFILPATAVAQSGLTLYALGDAISQNSHYNASYMPAGSHAVFGMPVISNMNIHINNKFSYKQAVEKAANGSYTLDYDAVISRLSRKNNFLVESHIPILYLAIKPDDSRSGFSLFINDKFFGGVQYQKELLETMWKGTGELIDRPINLKETVASSTYFREYGVGISTPFHMNRLKIGGRLKFVQGIFNIRSMPSMIAEISLEPSTYVYNFTFANAGVNTAGFQSLGSPKYLTGSSNKGVAVDVGSEWKLSKLISLSASVNDLGFIHWSEKDSKHFTMPDTTFLFAGIEMDDNVSSTLNTIEDTFAPKKGRNSYTTMLSSRWVLSGSMRLNTMEKISLVVMNQTLGNKLKSAFSVAYMRQMSEAFFFSGSVIKPPQHWPRPGAALLIISRPFQFFIASDNLLGLVNITNAKIVDLRFGINFISGGSKLRSATTSIR